MLIIKVEYSKTYSMIYDIMGLGRLIHNDESFLELLTENSINYENDKLYYKSLINKVRTPNKNVCSIFYQYKEKNVFKLIFRDIQFNDDVIKINSIDNFYKVFSNIDYILSIVNQVYFPELTITLDNLPTKKELYNKFLVMPVSKDVQNSLYILFDNPFNFCKLLVSELKTYGKVINKIYAINESEIMNFVSEFKDSKMEIYNKHYKGDLNDYKVIKIGVIYTNINLVYYNRCIEDTMILYLGKNSDIDIDRNYIPVVDFIKFKQLISDEVRLEILRILKIRDMYANEIAKEIKLKRNIVMYHIDTLVKENILDFYMKEKNIYYNTNNDYFQNIYQCIKEFL